MRARLALTLAAALGVMIHAAGAAARPHPQAYGATAGYLRSATSSCAGPAAVPGGFCTQLNTFTVTMRVVAGGRYRLDVANRQPRGNFRYFAWILPDGMTLRRVVGSSGGDCGESSGMITCARNLARRGCACAQRDLVVDFTASGRAPTRAKAGYWIHYGLVTPYLDVPSSFPDVPICDLGEKSTRQHPCLK